MKKFVRFLLALPVLLSQVVLAQIEDPQTGVPVRIWSTATSGGAYSTARSHRELRVEISASGTLTLGSNQTFTGRVEQDGSKRYGIVREAYTSTTYVTAALGLTSTFLPWSVPATDTLPAAQSDGSVSRAVTATSSGQSMTLDVGIVRAVPGRTYTIGIERINLANGAVFNVSPPPGYRAVLNNIPRNSAPLADKVTLRILPNSDFAPGLAGYASSVAGLKVDWRLALGSLHNGSSAGSLQLADTGLSADWAELFTPAALSYETTSDEVYVYHKDDVLRQIVANQVAVDIVKLTDTSYEIRCYNPAQIQTYVPCTFSGQPYATYRVEKETPPGGSDPTTIIMKFTRETRNIPDPYATSVAIARTDVMRLQRTGTWPDFQWTKTDWTQSGQSALVQSVASSPVSITTQPSAKTVPAGTSVTFTTAATGNPAPTYQWKKDGSNISGATSASLTISNPQSGDQGTYTVVVTNSQGSVTSSGGVLTINAGGSSPTITSHPASKAARRGSEVTLAATASGAATLTYQWKKNGSNISGATNSTLVLTGLKDSDAASYTVTVTNSSGSVTSNAATVTVVTTRTENIAISTPGGSTAAKLARTYTYLPSGEELTSETLGTTSARTTGFTYYGNPSEPGSFGYVKQVAIPGGGWENYTYYDTSLTTGFQVGQVKERHRPFVNSPTTFEGGSTGERTVYEYETDDWGARTRMKSAHSYVGSTLVGKTTYEYSEFPLYGGGPNEATGVNQYDYFNSTSFHYTATNRFKTSFGIAFVRGQPISIRSRDSTTTNYTYELGTWNGLAFTPGAAYIYGGPFPARSGSSSRISVVSATISTNPVVNQSTKAVTIRDERALVVRTETHVWTSSGWQLLTWTNYGYNLAGLLIARTNSNGTSYSASYDGLLKTSETDETGVTTTYTTYDAAGRLSVVTRSGSGSISSLSTRYTYDALSNVTEERVGWGLSEQLISTKQFDDAARLIAEATPGVSSTTHSYDVANRSQTATRPDGSTVIMAANLDGTPASKSGTGVVAEYYTYGTETDGRRWNQVNTGTSSSPRWAKTWKDWLGRDIKLHRPTFTSGETFVKEFFYNGTLNQTSTGKVVKTTEGTLVGSTLTANIAPTLYEYDSLGAISRTGLKLNTGTPDTLILASSDRITDTSKSYELYNGAWWLREETKAYPTANSATAVIMSLKRTRLTGFAANQTAETQVTDVNGNVTTTSVVLNRATATETVTATSSGIGRPSVRTLVMGLETSSTDTANLTTTTQYDSLRRAWKVTNARNNTTTTAYVTGTGLVDTVTDATSTIVADYGYDTMGRRISEASAPDPDASNARHYTYSSYTAHGKPYRVWGDATNPLEYGYDSTYGDRTTMTTFRTGAGWSSSTWPSSPGTGDVTTWQFHEGTGLLKKKLDADNKAVEYTYDARGALATRTWARGTVTTYVNDPKTGEQRDILYSDTTPELHYTYNRLGQATHITDATGSRVLQHCVCGKVYHEQLDLAYFGGRSLTYKLGHEPGTLLGRTEGYTLKTASGAVEQDLTYDYDPMSGRFKTLTTQGTFSAANHSFTYGYYANSPMLESLTIDSAGTPFISRGFEANRNVLTHIETKWASTTLTRYDYVVNALGQRQSMKQSGSAFSDYYVGSSDSSIFYRYTYDAKGQLTAATGYLGDTVNSGKTLWGRQFAYDYDHMGNREYSSQRTGDPALRDDYNVLANPSDPAEVAARDRKKKLNQIHTRENNTLFISGTLDASAKVEVAGRNQLAARQGRYWSDQLTVANVLAPWYGPLSVYAGKANAGPGGTADRVRVDARMGQIPKLVQTYEYDLDGNLTTDGIWNYSWDAENRLIGMETTTEAGAAGFPKSKLQFAYDYIGRRVSKIVRDQASGQLISARRFVYDRWNMIAEYGLDATLSTMTAARSYTWGLDIAETLTNAGGVGALVQVADHVSSKSFYPAYDGNGNVGALVNSANGALAAIYEYSPFGEPLRAETRDAGAIDQAFRFSTKYLDQETGMLYYGRRYYDPRTGRFFCRDPKEELGGIHLYAFVKNGPINKWDFLGMTGYAVNVGATVSPATGAIVSTDLMKTWVGHDDDDGYGGWDDGGFGDGGLDDGTGDDYNDPKTGTPNKKDDWEPNEEDCDKINGQYAKELAATPHETKFERLIDAVNAALVQTVVGRGAHTWERANYVGVDGDGFFRVGQSWTNESESAVSHQPVLDGNSAYRTQLGGRVVLDIHTHPFSDEFSFSDMALNYPHFVGLVITPGMDVRVYRPKVDPEPDRVHERPFLGQKLDGAIPANDLRQLKDCAKWARDKQ